VKRGRGRPKKVVVTPVVVTPAVVSTPTVTTKKSTGRQPLYTNRELWYRLLGGEDKLRKIVLAARLNPETLQAAITAGDKYLINLDNKRPRFNKQAV
jgi:hypothetical protein